MDKTVYLPGLNEQPELLFATCNIAQSRILILGTATPALVEELLDREAERVDVVINNEEMIMIERMRLPKHKSVKARFMDYSQTDFMDSSFDYVYAQGSISLPDRRKIYREMHRVLKPGGLFLAGELTYLKPQVPVSIKDVWEGAGVTPAFLDEIEALYPLEGFSLQSSHDLSPTLYTLYMLYQKILTKESGLLDDDELQLKRHEITRMKHESNMYTKMGGDRVTGYFVFILRKDA